MDSFDLNEDYIYLINNLGEVEAIHHSRIKILGLLNYFELDVLDEDFVFGVIYIQETLNDDRMVALIPRKLIIQINERLSSWNNEDEDVRIFTIVNREDISEKDLGNIYDGVDFKTICRASGVCKKDYFKTICPKSGVCIALAQYAKQIEDYFLGFTDFTYVSSVEKIPTSSANGFVHKILYDREGYTAQSVLKSSKKESADNLLYEYLVGQYINKKCDIFPCFIRTYGWFKYNSPADWEKMKDSTDITSVDLRDYMTKDDVLFETITQSKEKNCVDDKKNPLSIRECTALEYLLGFSCKNSTYLSVLIEHINSITLTMMAFSNREFISNNEILYVLYQVYMPLSTLRDEFTHYDLHPGNVLVYEPVSGKYIDYIYKLGNGEIIRFKSKYIAKIIDYGRSYFNDPSNQDISGSSKKIYDNICNNVIDCGDIGYDYGFLEMVQSSNRNVSKDLSLAAQVKRIIQKFPSSQNRSLLETLNKVDLSTYGARAPEKYENTGTGKIENMVDIHNELKKLVLQNKTQNEKEYKEFTCLGSLTIYETGKPMKFIPY